MLNVSPDSSSASDLPDMALEDGDRLTIPSRPSTIQVIGAVFNQNAFLCSKNARVGKYLRLAGGPAREADRHQIFVLRADGSVVHRQSGNSIFDSSDLDNVRLYPGDTIVVPEKIVRPSGLRELTAWTRDHVSAFFKRRRTGRDQVRDPSAQAGSEILDRLIANIAFPEMI